MEKSKVGIPVKALNSILYNNKWFWTWSSKQCWVFLQGWIGRANARARRPEFSLMFAETKDELCCRRQWWSIQESCLKLQSNCKKEITIKPCGKLSFRKNLWILVKSKTSNLLIQIMFQFSAWIVVNAYVTPFPSFSGFCLADGGSCTELQQQLLRLKPCFSPI